MRQAQSRAFLLPLYNHVTLNFTKRMAHTGTPITSMFFLVFITLTTSIGSAFLNSDLADRIRYRYLAISFILEINVESLVLNTSSTMGFQLPILGICKCCNILLGF